MYTAPKALTAPCTMMVPTAVMENCRPMGIPMPSSWLTARRSGEKSCLLSRKMSNFRII